MTPPRASSPLALPWELLVAPVSAWRRIAAAPVVWPAFVAEGALLVLGMAIAAKPMAELAKVAATAAAGHANGAAGSVVIAPATAGGLSSGLAQFALIVVALALSTAVLFALARLFGYTFRYRELLAWVAYGTLPLYLGRFLALISFAIAQPLAKDPAQAQALQISPVPFGLAPLFSPLSLAWTFAVSFDAFGLWTLLLLALGAREFLNLRGAKLGWLLALLILLWLLALTAIWQGLQASVH